MTRLRLLLPALLLAPGFVAALTSALSADDRAPSLAGSEWGLAREHDASHGGEAFVQFRKDRVIGHGGCNSFSGSYTCDGTLLSIGPLVTTRKACAPAIMSAERAFLGLLQGAATATATHTALVLKDSSGAPLATFRRRDWD